ncbi:MAG: hypothetical protein SOR57_04510 [Parabacteroides sp.]|nr:hypothetical protein [Parabacteroides sp.]
MRKYIDICLYTLLLLSLGMIQACSQQEDFPDVPSGKEFYEVGIELGTKNSESSSGDLNARENEFIHTLCLFITDEQGKVEVKLHPDLSGDAAAKEGRLKHWESTEPLLLTAGKKKVYAFANWEKLKNINGDSLEKVFEDIKVGQSFQPESWIVDNPSETIDFQTGFIPMSSQLEVSISSAQTVKVELVRLLVRVDVTVKNEQKESIQLTRFFMENLGKEVGLMTSVESEEKVLYEYDFSQQHVRPGQIYEFSFYTNETMSKASYPIALQIDESAIYQGETGEILLPRNSILPLNLIVVDNSLELTVKAWLAPIGGYPVEVLVKNPGLDGNYVVDLPEGCQFEVGAKLKSEQGYNEPGTCFLSYYNNVDYSSILQIEGSDHGFITAMPSQVVLLLLQFESCSGKKAECILQINTKGLEDFINTDKRAE